MASSSIPGALRRRAAELAPASMQRLWPAIGSRQHVLVGTHDGEAVVLGAGEFEETARVAVAPGRVVTALAPAGASPPRSARRTSRRWP